jgi:hypothetical protein
MIKLIYIDVVDLIHFKEFDKSQWYVVFMNDYTCWWYICNMKMKDQTQIKIKWFINMIYTQMNWTLKCVWIDNETEFDEESFIEWLQDHKIEYEFTVFMNMNKWCDWKSNELLAAKAKAMILNSEISKTL